MKTLSTILLLVALVSISIPTRTHAQQGDQPNFGELETAGDIIGEKSIDAFVKEDPKTTTMRFIAALVNYAVAAIILIGLMTIVAGGYVYMTAGGSADRVGQAKTLIGSALLGIILALLAVTILNTVSPQFTSF